MTTFQFMNDNPWLSFFLATIAGNVLIIMSNRILRHWNIRKHGYPPAHCDADGNFKSDE